MCGIIGAINYSGNFNANDNQWVESEIKYLRHRGPDDEKIWTSSFKDVIFGHTKLSIIDLSDNNTQPMHDESNGITLTFNGEIYNYLDLRNTLSKNFKFQTNSDTEVIIKSYLKWGESFLEKLEGMFALALLDEKKKNIYIARDRLGEKPLFYLSMKDKFLFSSELKSFHSWSKIDKKVLNETLLNGFPINRSETLLIDIKQIEPGEFLKVQLEHKNVIKKKFWNLPFNVKSTTSSKEIDFDKILNLNIEKCLNSDVKTCVTLSGGLDSSLVTAIASKQKKIDTFSIVFKDKNFDERKHISKISNYFKTNHNEIEIDECSLEEVINIIKKFDLPVLDSSIIPSYILFNKLHQNNYKVAVGGDGGDEIFGGYNHYRIFNKINKIRNKFFNFDISFLNFFFKKIENLNFKGAQYIDFLTQDKLVYKIPFFFKKNLRQKIIKSKYFEDINHLKSNNQSVDIIRQSQFIDIGHTLPLSLLNKLDRCSMLNSVESRSPLLSKDIVEFSLTQLETSDLVSENNQKKFLKKIGSNYLPKSFVFDRKQGFSFPLINIFKNQKEMKKIEEILTSRNSIYDHENIIKMIKATKVSKVRSELIFCLLNIQIWINKNNIEI
jgi:asparagine synthase (glutamine-hydrolysing)